MIKSCRAGVVMGTTTLLAVLIGRFAGDLVRSAATASRPFRGN
jgi:hypothetical protein